MNYDSLESEIKGKHIIAKPEGIFFSLDPIRSPDSRSKCPSGWTIKSFLGKGTFGKVFTTCCEKKCGYVVKISELRTDWMRSSARKEFCIWKSIQGLGLSPKLIDAHIEKNYSMFIMEVMTGDIMYLMEKYPSKELLELIINKVGNILSTLHKNEIIHGDTHYGNFMYKVADDKIPKNVIKAIESGKIKIKVIDFGQSTTFELEIQEGTDAERAIKFKLKYDFYRFMETLMEFSPKGIRDILNDNKDIVKRYSDKYGIDMDSILLY